MMHWLGRYCLLVAAVCISSASLAGPWFTGPIIAPNGHTIPSGHTNLETYYFDTKTTGVYGPNWQVIHTTPTNNNYILNFLLTHGLTDNIDFQFSLPFTYNHAMGHFTHHITDTAATLGYQVLEQKKSRWIPDLRFTIQQIIPTGAFTGLNPLNNGSDASGSGSYQTGFALNFQHLTTFSDVHYLRTRLSLSYVYDGHTFIWGINAYGGTPTTHGTVNPGNYMSADLAGEFTLTQNWVAVMEGYVSHRQQTTFRGYPGILPNGDLAVLYHPPLVQVNLAPAIEFNFNQNIGLIGGYWFSVAGKNTPFFGSFVMALNAYW